MRTGATIEVHHVFSEVFLNWELKTCPKTDFEKLKSTKVHGLGTHREYLKMAWFRRFWGIEPRHSETVSDEICHLYRSIRRHAVHVKRDRPKQLNIPPTFCPVSAQHSL